MALNPSRAAWPLPRIVLRPLQQSAAAATRPACRAHQTLARQPTGLRERDDPLNRPVTGQDLEEARPRWSYTPEGLKGKHGFSLNFIKHPERAVWHVNEDPEKLDEFYERFLGRHGSKVLPDEVKWLAVTHKSFDYGRRGFNTRLAFYGRQIMVVEVMNTIMTGREAVPEHVGDPWKREPFQSPALQSVDKLSMTRPQDFMSPQKLASVAVRYNMDEVVRWKPRNPFKLQTSGIETVLATTVFAIVGAVSLQHGGAAAAKVAQERIIRRMIE